jgi:hypothetical protein
VRGPEGRPEGVGPATLMGFGEGPAAELCRTMIQRTALMGAGVVCSMTPSLHFEGEGPYPKGARPSHGSRPWGVRAERAEARGATSRRPAGDAGRSVSSADEG